MTKDKIGYSENNYIPLNNAIDESIRAQRAKSSWQYAKVFALVLFSIGLLALLLAWAYNIFKKPNPELVKTLKQMEQKIEQSENIDKPQEKLVEGQIVKYNSTTLKFNNFHKDGYTITTRYRYDATKDLLEGKRPEKTSCYIERDNIVFELDNPVNAAQLKTLGILGLTENQARNYQKFCSYNN